MLRSSVAIQFDRLPLREQQNKMRPAGATSDNAPRRGDKTKQAANFHGDPQNHQIRSRLHKAQFKARLVRHHVHAPRWLPDQLNIDMFHTR